MKTIKLKVYTVYQRLMELISTGSKWSSLNTAGKQIKFRLPNAFSINGTLGYQWPYGSITAPHHINISSIKSKTVCC